MSSIHQSKIFKEPQNLDKLTNTDKLSESRPVKIIRGLFIMNLLTYLLGGRSGEKVRTEEFRWKVTGSTKTLFEPILSKGRFWEVSGENESLILDGDQNECSGSHYIKVGLEVKRVEGSSYSWCVCVCVCRYVCRTHMIKTEKTCHE